MAGSERRPWLVVQHVAHEGPGLIGPVLEGAGIDVEVCRTDVGEPLPPSRAVRSYGGLVVMGGPMGVDDNRDSPWLVAERDLLEKAVADGLVVLGVCLGAQQLAVALGAAVQRGPEVEVGLGTVTLTPEGVEDPVLGPAGSPLPCLHWHGDTFGLPDGAVLLAGNDRYEHQAFRVGDRVYGLQFHVEATPELTRSWAAQAGGSAFAGADDDQLAPLVAAGTGIIGRLVAQGDR